LARPTLAAAGASSSNPLPLVAGYDILEVVGHGGMGIVYKARQVKLNRLIALKMILWGAPPAELARFRTEAEVVASLEHPHIIRIYEVGEHAGHPYLVLEWADRGNLAGHLSGAPLPAQSAAGLLLPLARAVALAHARGIIHRDLKPANVLLRTNDKDATAEASAQAPRGSILPAFPLAVPKIADFGLAKRLDADQGQTQTGAVLGTPSYMAPEQAKGKKEIGPATDIYALGAILYELLTGRPPFQGESSLETMREVTETEPVQVRRLHPTVPRDLETICLKCLQKAPGKRYLSAEALADDLGRFLAGQPIRARPVGAAERALKWARRRPAAAAYGLLLTALVLGLGGGGATWLWRRAEKARDDLKDANNALQQARDDLKGALRGEREAKRRLTQYSYADAIYIAQHEWDAGNVTVARELLQKAADLQEELTPGRRPWEWHYLKRVVHPEVAVLRGHTVSVAGLSWRVRLFSRQQG
jgi:hypothetical protein